MLDHTRSMTSHSKYFIFLIKWHEYRINYLFYGYNKVKDWDVPFHEFYIFIYNRIKVYEWHAFAMSWLMNLSYPCLMHK